MYYNVKKMIGGNTMKIKELSLLMKGIVLVLAVAGLGFFFAFMPLLGLDFIKDQPVWYWVWLGFLWVLALPLGYLLVVCFLASCDVEKGKVFTKKNAKRLWTISVGCLADACLLLVGNVGFLCIGVSNLTVFFTAMFLTCGLGIVAVASGCLASFVHNSALMREENESFV